MSDFTAGSLKCLCRIYFAEKFDALRRKCGLEDDFVNSLSSCIKWDAVGGQSGSSFFKTRDDRFVIKQMSRLEIEAFLRFAPSYFEYMSQAFFHDLPTVLTKLFGVYRIEVKNTVTNRAMKVMDVVVMENLFYRRRISRIFDLKGSLRNRNAQVTGRQSDVLLDENFLSCNKII